MSCPTCNHRKADGVLCGSPTLRGKKLCYFHQRDHRRQANIARVLRRSDPLNPHAPLPKTLPDIQVALYEIMKAVAEKRIPSKRAGVLLFSLQQQSLSLRQPHPA
jgi:hypothetical protein